MSQSSIPELSDRIKDFCTERDWDQFHTPSHLAIGISTEAAELLELFRFKSDDDVKEMMKDPKKRMMMSEELGDIMFFVLRFADMNGFNLSECVLDKLEKTGKKYPVDKCKGRNLKYNEY